MSRLTPSQVPSEFALSLFAIGLIVGIMVGAGLFGLLIWIVL